MKRIKLNKRHLWIFYVFPLVLFTDVACYPTGKPNLETQPELRDEKHFPNGTVIGKYTYMDNEGNPIQVKYYADDASYGVELKSIKVVDSTGEPLSSATQNIQSAPAQYEYKNEYKNEYNSIKNADPEMKMATDVFSNNNFPTMGYKYKNDPYDFLNKEVSKTNRYKIEKPNSNSNSNPNPNPNTNPDYEIFYQNELKGPKKCTKEKVRVYFDKENRKIRNAVNNFEADKFCEQF